MTTKFRAWLVDEKRMLHEGEIHSILLDGGKPFMLHVGYFKDGRSVDKYVDLGPKCVLMQSTGFGKEIYEGDIVKVSYCSDDDEGYSQKGFFVDQVSYSRGGFYFGKPNSDPFGMDYMYGWEPEDIEIIGNIYENPELLEGKK